MTEHEQTYANAKSFLNVARGFLTDLAVLFEEDENSHDQATVEDIIKNLNEVIDSTESLPENLIGENL